MKTFIVIALLAFAPFVHASTDRAMFMCSVGTGVCPEVKKIDFVQEVFERPSDFKAIPEPQILATSTTDTYRAELLELIEQLQMLIERIKLQEVHGG